MTQALNRDIPGIDILKFLMAMAVVFDHYAAIFYESEGVIPSVVRWVMEAPVPVFFIATGYLTYGIRGDADKLRRRGLHLLRIWALWILIYLPTELIKGYGADEGLLRFGLRLLVEGVTRYSWMLWFLYAMALFFIIESLLAGRPAARRLVRAVYLVSFLLYSYGMYHYDYVLYRLCIVTPIRVFYGCQLILIGTYIRRLCESAHGHVTTATVLLLLSGITFFAADLPCWNTLTGAAFFLAAAGLNLRPRKIYLHARHASAWAYYTHMYVLLAMLIMTGRGLLHTHGAHGLAAALAAVLALAWALALLQTRVRALARLVS